MDERTRYDTTRDNEIRETADQSVSFRTIMLYVGFALNAIPAPLLIILIVLGVAIGSLYFNSLVIEKFNWFPVMKEKNTDLFFALVFAFNTLTVVFLLIVLGFFMSLWAPPFVFMGMLAAIPGVFMSVIVDQTLRRSDHSVFKNAERSKTQTMVRRIFLHTLIGLAGALVLLTIPILKPFPAIVSTRDSLTS